MSEEASIESLVDLYDHEIVQIEDIGRRLQEKYFHSRATKANLESLVHEAEDAFRAIGFEITVHLGRRLLREVFGADFSDPDGTMPDDLTIQIAARAKAQEYDHDRQGWEVKKGVADEFWNRKREQAATPPAPEPPAPPGIIVP